MFELIAERVTRAVSGRASHVVDAAAGPSQRSAPLDGIRGLAILAVLANHTGQPLARGGYLGVDLFFVLSGYLITALLLREHQRYGRISLRRFYLRRILRLYP